MATITSIDSIKEVIRHYADILKNELNIRGVYIYGSYAKGTFNEDSDIDVIVVSDDFTGDLFNDRLKLMRLRRNIDTRIEPYPVMTDEFNETNPFIYEIANNIIKVE